MVRMVTEIAQGNTFSETSEEGRGAYSATRAWKVLLTAPDEAYDINELTGVSIGDAYTEANPLPCVSLEVRPDGDSRLVKIITATYRATPGFTAVAGGDAPADPKTVEPTVRAAVYSMSTSLQEIAAWGFRQVTGAGNSATSQAWGPAVNPVGDMIDGITRLEPVVTINIEQYSYSDGTDYAGYVGYVNSLPFTFSSMSIGVHCCMLQGVSSTPVVEQFNSRTFRGFKLSFAFAVRSHWALTRYGVQPIGWDIAAPQTGHNALNMALSLLDSTVEKEALNLLHDRTTQQVKTPFQLEPGVDGKKMPAMVLISGRTGGIVQQRAAMPIPLNDNGTPRSRDLNPRVLINRLCLQPEMPFGDNFSEFGIRFYYPTLP